MRSPPACRTGLATALGRLRREGRALLRLGLDRPPRPRRPPTRRSADTQCWWLLVRRHRRTGELAFYRCYSPALVPLRELVRVAGRRWTVEESFQAAKGLAGLDEHQVRRWTSWRRWTLLTMIAHALLAVIAAKRAHPSPTGRADPADLQRDPPTVHRPRSSNPAASIACPLAWSHWRRRHQHRARTSHYNRQESSPRLAITIYGWSTSCRIRTRMRSRRRRGAASGRERSAGHKLASRPVSIGLTSRPSRFRVTVTVEIAVADYPAQPPADVPNSQAGTGRGSPRA